MKLTNFFLKFAIAISSIMILFFSTLIFMSGEVKQASADYSLNEMFESYSDLILSEEEVRAIEEVDNKQDEFEDVVVIDSDLIQESETENVQFEEYIPEPQYDYGNYYQEQYYGDSEALNASNGVVNYNGHRETYYSQNVLPGGGLAIPGRCVGDDGTIRDADGYICVAANQDWMNDNGVWYGSTVDTSLGSAKIYDTCEIYGTIDVYTNW